MSYLVIARKYRPQRFDDVVGQEHITRTLKNAIKYDKISHAYLFSGPRGVGKTTSARILAKAVNCQNPKGEEPCNECSSCKEITQSSSVDIIEIDAASNRGVDEIRELRENVKFAPASSKYKLYIIDEVHMLTKPAFNAILKTLEEPPDHVIFVMATTEPEKLLDTITSRCQNFTFKLIPEKEIKEALKRIAEKEKVNYEEEGLDLIASAAKGSMRDAESLMDQTLSFSGGKITETDTRKALGMVPREFLFEYAELFIKSDPRGAIKLNQKIINEGYSVKRVFDEMHLHFRNLMFARVMKDSLDEVGFNKDYAQKLSEAAKDFSEDHLVWICEFMTSTEKRMKFSENSHIVFDTVVFKLCQQYVGYDDLMKIMDKGKNGGEKVVKKTSGAVNKVVENTGPNDDKKGVDKRSNADREKSSPSSSGKRKKPRQGGKWDTILKLLKKESLPLFHTAKKSEVELIGKAIVINWRDPLEPTDKHKQIMKDKINQVMGEDYYPDFRMSRKKEEKAPKKKVKKKKRITPAKIEEDEPLVREIVELFGGRIEKISK